MPLYPDQLRNYIYKHCQKAIYSTMFKYSSQLFSFNDKWKIQIIFIYRTAIHYRNDPQNVVADLDIGEVFDCLQILSAICC